MSNQIKPQVFTIKIRLSSSQASEHNKKAKALGYKNFRDYANNRTNILTAELLQEHNYHIQEQARALLERYPAEAVTPPDSAAVVSAANSVPSGKEIVGYNEDGELVSEAWFEFSVTGSEGANEGTITINPAESNADLDLGSIRSQSSGDAEFVNIVGPGQDGPKTILETVELNGVNPVATKGFYNGVLTDAEIKDMGLTPSKFTGLVLLKLDNVETAGLPGFVNISKDDFVFTYWRLQMKGPPGGRGWTSLLIGEPSDGANQEIKNLIPEFRYPEWVIEKYRQRTLKQKRIK